MPRIVARKSMARPRAAARVRRMAISGSGSLSSASICLTSINSSAVIVAKSFFCSTSRAENVNAASNSISRISESSSGFGDWISACASRAGICGVWTSPNRPCTFGRSAAIILSSNFGSKLRQIVLVFEQHAERIGDRLRIERDAVEREQRLGPIQRFGDAWRLEQIHRAKALRERDDFACERFRRARTFAPDDGEL